MQSKKPVRDDLFQQTSRLSEATEKNRQQLIRSELAVARTFSQVADTEWQVGNRERAKKIIHDAKKAVEQASIRVREMKPGGRQSNEMREQIGRVLEKIRELETKAA